MNSFKKLVECDKREDIRSLRKWILRLFSLYTLIYCISEIDTQIPDERVTSEFAFQYGQVSKNQFKDDGDLWSSINLINNFGDFNDD